MAKLRTEDSVGRVKLNSWATKLLRKVIGQVLRKVGVTSTLLFILDMIADMTKTKADDKIVDELKKAINPK